MFFWIVFFGFFYGALPALLRASYNRYAVRAGMERLEPVSWLNSAASGRNNRKLRSAKLVPSMERSLFVGLIAYRIVVPAFWLSVILFIASVFLPIGLSPI